MDFSLESKRAFKLSLPILFAYGPLGIVYGVLFAHSDFSWWLAPVTSAVVFAGAVQFVALSMMADHAGVFTIVLATIFIAFRNSFYGLNLLERFKTNWLTKNLLIFMLVDATYVILMSNPAEDNQDDVKFCFLLSFYIYLYWVIGTLIGAIFSKWIPDFSAIAFILPAFFGVLVIEYFIAKRRLHTLIAPICAAIIAYLIYPKQFLLIAILLSLGVILGIHYMSEKKHA